MNHDAPPQTSRGKVVFERFVVGTDRESARAQSGVITELRILRDSGELPEYERDHVEEIFKWFNEHLPVPPFSSADWRTDAVSWFKPTGVEFVARIRAVIAILEANGRFVRTIRTTEPGVILYEDNFQVVARSWRY